MTRGACPTTIAAVLAVPVLAGCTGDSQGRADPRNDSAASPAAPLSDSSGTDINAVRDRIRLEPTALVGVYIEIAPALRDALNLPPNASRSLGSAVTDAIAVRLREHGRETGIFNVDAPVPLGAANVLINLSAARGAAGGRSYRIVLKARQGTSRWSQSMTRLKGLNPNYAGIADENGQPTGNPEFESVLMDARELSKKLSADMQF